MSLCGSVRIISLLVVGLVVVGLVVFGAGVSDGFAQDVALQDPAAFVEAGGASMDGAPIKGTSFLMKKLGELLPLFFMVFIIFYFMVLRPQDKEQRTHQKMLSELRGGVLVKTQAGIIGKVVSVEDDAVTLEIANGVKVKFERQAILGRVEKASADVKIKNGDSPRAISGGKQAKSKQSA